MFYFLFITFIITVGIMVLLAIAIIVEIPKNFHGMNSATSVAPAVIQRYGLLCLRLSLESFVNV